MTEQVLQRLKDYRINQLEKQGQLKLYGGESEIGRDENNNRKKML